MEMKADPSHVLMSEALKGQVPELDGEQIEEIAAKHVTVLLERIVGGKSDPMVGILRGMLLGDNPEIEFRCSIEDAMLVLGTQDLHVGKIQLHHGDGALVEVSGPFDVKARRIDEIVAQDQLCTLGLHLMKRPA